MKWFPYIGLLAVSWAQDSIQAIARMVGDYVEVAFYWRGRSSEIPLGANFVLVGSPATSIAWRTASVSMTGQWSAPNSNLYRPLYLTAREEEPSQFRISLNLLTQVPSNGLPLSANWSLIGAWKAPVLHFNDTLHLTWSMITGEIVLAPFVRAKSHFTYIDPPPLRLCPDFPRLRLAMRDGEFTVTDISDFRPENLSIRWYKDGVLVHEGLSYAPAVEGSYHAEVHHVCGSAGRTDTLVWRSTSVGILVDRDWRIYPNPTTGKLWIEAPQPCHAQIFIRDATGRLLYSQTETIETGRAKLISLPSLSAGLYHISIHTEKETISLPISYAP
ncbi:MAG: T9SS type A sorting domain-containing protein [Bacteroidia bacterium]